MIFSAILPETFNILLCLRSVNYWHSWNRKDLKTLWFLFINGTQLSQGYRTLRGDFYISLFTDRFPGVSSSFDRVLKDEKI